MICKGCIYHNICLLSYTMDDLDRYYVCCLLSNEWCDGDVEK